jgi:hypothetical protein
MLLIEGYISNFTCARYYFLYVEFSDFYVNQSLAGQTTYTKLHIIEEAFYPPYTYNVTPFFFLHSLICHIFYYMYCTIVKLFLFLHLTIIF